VKKRGKHLKWIHNLTEVHAKHMHGATKSTCRKELEVSFAGARTDPYCSCNITETELLNCNGDVTEQTESERNSDGSATKVK
jgi:hypothetical protein